MAQKLRFSPGCPAELHQRMAVFTGRRPANDPKAEDYGHALYYGHLVLGRVALGRDHDVAKAKSALLTAGQTPGSRVLKSFGPDMTLAKELLEVGERDTVLQFFEECRSFWTINSGAGALDAWTAVVKGCCRLPKFGANLSYW